MHTFSNRAFSHVAFAAADTSTGTVSLAPLGSEAAKHPSNLVVSVSVPKRAKAAKPVTAKADKPSKPVTDSTDEKPVFRSGSYLGASPAFRPHGGKLSPIIFGRIAGAFTDRDNAALHDLFAEYGTRNFLRCDPKHGINVDAGIASRLEAHGYLRHVSGNAALRDCVLALTPAAAKYCKPVTATPAKAKR